MPRTIARIKAGFFRLLFYVAFIGVIASPLRIGAAESWEQACTLVGILLGIFLLFGIRRWGGHHLLVSLKPRPCTRAEDPHWSGFVREFSRRLGIPSPRLAVIDSPCVNLCAFGFSPSTITIGVTQGLLDRASPQVLSGLLARALTLLKSGEVPNQTWLVSLLAAAELLVQLPRRPGKLFRPHPIWVFVRRILLYPVLWLPIYLLKQRTSPEALDAEAAQILQHPRDLSEGLRLLDAYGRRAPLTVPVTLHPIFLGNTGAPDPMLRVFLLPASLMERIRSLESGPLHGKTAST